MTDHDHRRVDDDPIYNVFKNWQFYASVAMALVAIGGYMASFRLMSTAISEGEQFQREQIGINAKLQTLIDSDGDRLHDLESWRDDMDRWNKRR